MDIDLEIASAEWHANEISKFVERYERSSKTVKSKMKSQIPFLKKKLKCELNNLEKLLSE